MCKNNLCSSVSNAAWCALNSRRNIFKLHDICNSPKCKCLKQISFTPKQLQLEGGSIKSELKKTFKGTAKAWNSFVKPKIYTLEPVIGTAVAAKTKNTQSAKIYSNTLKCISRGIILSLTVMLVTDFV